MKNINNPHLTHFLNDVVPTATNVKRFGEVSDLILVDGCNGKWAVFSKDRQLTNVRF